VSRDPEDTQAHVLLARAWLAEAQYARAAAQLEEARRRRPADVEIHLLLADALSRGPRPELVRARQVLEGAARLAPLDGDVQLRLAHVCEHLKDDARATEAFERSAEVADNDVTKVAAYLGLVGLYRRRGDEQRARSAHEAARRVYPGVDDLLRTIEIRRLVPPPQYRGGHVGESADGSHPPLEDRIRQVREHINRPRDPR
jgi:predicted Zn-dependent protease